MLLTVVDAKYMRDYRLSVRFNDGKSMVVDLADELDGPVFEPLRHVAFFRKFRIAGNTIEWPNGADFAPEFLREIGRDVSETGTVRRERRSSQALAVAEAGVKYEVKGGRKGRAGRKKG
jgi:hypothetical protein